MSQPISALERSARIEHQRIRDARGPDDHLLMYLAKLTEELGELSKEVTRTYGSQPDQVPLREELADVLISAGVLAVAIGYSPDELVLERQAQLDRRWATEPNRHLPG